MNFLLEEWAAHCLLVCSASTFHNFISEHIGLIKEVVVFLECIRIETFLVATLGPLIKSVIGKVACVQSKLFGFIINGFYVELHVRQVYIYYIILYLSLIHI